MVTSSPSSLIYICPGDHTDVTILSVLCDRKRPIRISPCYVGEVTSIPDLNQASQGGRSNTRHLEAGLENNRNRRTIKEQSQPISCCTTVSSVSQPRCCLDGSDLPAFPRPAQHPRAGAGRYLLARLRPWACAQVSGGGQEGLGPCSHGRKPAVGPAFWTFA